MSAATSSIAITGAGVATSLGFRSSNVCAAVRAGISRAAPTSELLVPDSESMEMVPLMAHSVRHVSEGFLGVARLVQLGRRCVESLRAEGLDPLGGSEARRETRLIVVTRQVDADFMGLDSDEHTEKEAESLFEKRFIGALGGAIGAPLREGAARLIFSGSTGVAEGLDLSAEYLREHGEGRVLLLAVDSWMEPERLAAVSEQHRLKAGGSAHGLTPGEAAVALVLEEESAARAIGHGVLGRVLGIDRRAEASNPIESPGGPGLAACLGAVLSSPGVGDSVGDMILDLSGEEWRAIQWANALTRLGQRVADVRMLVPATSLGDVGAASGALGMCLALESHRRRWARGETTLLALSSETGAVSGIAVSGSPS